MAERTKEYVATVTVVIGGVGQLNAGERICGDKVPDSALVSLTKGGILVVATEEPATEAAEPAQEPAQETAQPEPAAEEVKEVVTSGTAGYDDQGRTTTEKRKKE